MKQFYCRPKQIFKFFKFHKLNCSLGIILMLAFYISGCQSRNQLPPGDPDNGGLLLPDGFEAVVVADSVGRARHLAIRDNGDIYVKLRNSEEQGGIIALRDTTGNGKADIQREFGEYEEGSYETGIKIHKGHLYFSNEFAVWRYKLTPGKLIPEGRPEGKPELIMREHHEHGFHEHITKPLTFDGEGNLYVPFGAPTNACQEPKRTPGQPGLDPCPQLEDHAGIWQFNDTIPNQTQTGGKKFATGIRSVVAMDWNPVDNNLYVVIHGRDNLHKLFPNEFSPWENAVLPSEEFVRVTEGSDFGWPYCYYDHIQEEKVLAPEYGGDGKIIGRCDQYQDPLIGFPGHFAPNGLKFYTGDQFPGHYQNGAFIAFHGSTIRAPYPQAGYFVGFVPFEDGEPSGEWEVFANDFAGVDPIVNTSDAAHRPTGLAIGPDGSLYVSESEQGKIWRIMYKGNKEDFGEAALAKMNEEKRTASNIKRPDPEADILEQKQEEDVVAGEKIYNQYCATCHQRDGGGASPRYPPLTNTDWVTGDKERLIGILLNGLEGPIEVKGETYNNFMPQHSFLSNEDAADVLTYIRKHFGNDASEVTPEEVAEVRASLEQDN